MATKPEAKPQPMTCQHCGSPIRWVEGHGWAKPNDAYAEMGYCAKREQGHQLVEQPSRFGFGS